RARLAQLLLADAKHHAPELHALPDHAINLRRRPMRKRPILLAMLFHTPPTGCQATTSRAPIVLTFSMQ
ncbi:MAG: hypothetical protein AAF346_24105, partial [Pseudomonadota bacterium]